MRFIQNHHGPMVVQHIGEPQHDRCILRQIVLGNALDCMGGQKDLAATSGQAQTNVKDVTKSMSVIGLPHAALSIKGGLVGGCRTELERTLEECLQGIHGQGLVTLP